MNLSNKALSSYKQLIVRNFCGPNALTYKELLVKHRQKETSHHFETRMMEEVE